MQNQDYCLIPVNAIAGVSAYEQNVLIWLYYFAIEGVSSPSLITLAQHAGLGHRTIQRILKRLVFNHHIEPITDSSRRHGVPIKYKLNKWKEYNDVCS